MCGIAGFSRFHIDRGDEDTLNAMGDAIAHRGPDANGSHLEPKVGLHHRRLAIIDLSEAGNQPMVSADGRYVIVFNGEIYNFLELRSELAATGYAFKTETDTEVILASYARSGPECLKSLNGMFAFALWDREREELLLARDRLGKKPLYYALEDGDITFASELKALMRCAWFRREIRLDALYDFFAFQYVPDPKTIFQGANKLEPGHYMVLDKDGATKTRYWDVSCVHRSVSDGEAVAEARRLINESTERRMIADVPLGAFLSGGIDSSGIVAMMAAQSDKPTTTCSIGFDDKKFNETEFARLVAEHHNTQHHEYEVKDTVAQSLVEIARFFDEPFADPSLVPTYFVSKLARQRVTVALAGDGGDEIFAGYEKYSIDEIESRWRERVPPFLRGRLRPLARLLRKIPLRFFQRGATALAAVSSSPAEALYLSNAQITDEEWLRIAAVSTRRSLGDYHPSHTTIEAYNRCDGPDHLSRVLYTDLTTYLPGDILVKVDRMSMAHALEVRAPLLDYRVVEYASSLPSDMKMRNGEKKWVLKEVFKDTLPGNIISRKKMGFSVPLDEWFRNELQTIAQRTLFDAEDGLPRFFRIGEIRGLWQEHQSRTRDHGALLWSLLMFQLWWNAYMTVGD